MDSEEFNGLEKAISVLEHQDMLIGMQVAAYPYMKKESASKLHKEVYKKAFPAQVDKKGIMTVEEAEAFLKGGFNG